MNDFNVPTTSFNPLFLSKQYRLQILRIILNLINIYNFKANQMTNDYQNIFELDLTQIKKLQRENSFKRFDNSTLKDLSLKRTAPTAYPQVYPVNSINLIY